MGYLYPILFISYFICKLYLHSKVIKKLSPLYAIPSSLNPFEFYILEQNKNILSGYLYNAISKNKRRNKVYNSTNNKQQQLAETSTVYREIKLITRALTITNVSTTDEGVIITASDLAVRNFGGKFAKTTLKFDSQGNLISEMANI